MSIEQLMQDLTVALTRVADALEKGPAVQTTNVANITEKPKADKPEVEKPEVEKPPELEYKNHAAAKVALMAMLAKLQDSEDEPEAMRLLLAPMGVKKMSSVSIETLSPQISKMEDIVTELNKAFDTPAETPEDPDKKVTVDDLKTICSKIVNHEKLGMEVVKNIVSEFGVTAIKEVPEDDLTAAYLMAEASLATVEG